MTESGKSKTSWGFADIGDQSGKFVLVTGAAAGVGFESAKALAKNGATVILACRSQQRAEDAAKRIRNSVNNAKLETLALDLSSLNSIHTAAATVKEKFGRLDVLMNNAGVMVPPYELTEDGFESQFGVNHLGHFALTGLLLDLLMSTPNSRIVTVSSTAHKRGRINFDDLQSKQNYVDWRAYCQSKIANLMFTFELQKRLAKTGSTTIAVASHPGYSRTDLQRHANKNLFMRSILQIVGSFASQSSEEGALPQLRATVDAHAKGNDYFGPAGPFESKGPPVLVKAIDPAHDAAQQQRLWKVSEELTGIKYAI